MDKQTFCWILESALLRYDGAKLEELIRKWKIPKELAERGIKMWKYLTNLEKLGGINK